jgi:hypothetical protein
MGCIFFEFAIWLLEGSEGLNAFNRRNQFWESQKSDESHSKQPTVPSSVRSKVEQLQEDPGCTQGTALWDVLTLVVDHMLRVDLKDRAGAEELLETLNNIHRETDRNPEYLLASTKVQPHGSIRHVTGHLGSGLVVASPPHPSTVEDAGDISFAVPEQPVCYTPDLQCRPQSQLIKLPMHIVQKRDT